MNSPYLLRFSVWLLYAATSAIGFGQEPTLPEGLQVGQLIHQASMADPQSVEGWKMDGPGEVSFQDGWMQMRSPGEAMHHVYWCPVRFPEDFIAQWEAQNLNPDAGLCIVFFAATSLDGQSVFASDLPPRDGTFTQYTKGSLRCYHISYHANTPDAPDRGHANLRKNPGFHLVLEGQDGISAKSEEPHLVTLAKIGDRIRLWVDARPVIDWKDSGEIGGEPHRDGYIGFRQMQWTHFKYRNLRVWQPDDDSTAAISPLSDDAIAQRRLLLLEQTARRPLKLDAKDPKHQHPTILARLALGTATEEDLSYLPRGASYHDRGSMFGMASLARILAAHEDQIPPKVIEEIREQVLAYPHFLGGGTENHRAMNRAAGLIFGQRWPDERFHHRITGRELAEVCRKYVRDYGQLIYGSSMKEYLSPVYHATNTAPWILLADHAADAETQQMGRAIADWMMADLALNMHHTSIMPPLVRSRKNISGGTENDRWDLGSTARTAWIYWGAGTADPKQEIEVRSESVPAHAHSHYRPHPVIRRLGAKQVAFPFSVRQSRPSHTSLEPISANPYGYVEREAPEDGPADDRYHLRSVYFDRNFAIGGGYFRENIYDPNYRESIAFGTAWRSSDRYAWLTVGHPYWFVNHRPETWESHSPQDMWSGVSPFQQMIHHENAAILLYDIPKTDPHDGVRLRWGASFADPKPSAHPIQACFAWFPQSIDERVKADGIFFLREGDVYVAIRPLGDGAVWEASAIPHYSRICIPGGHTGCVIEVGDAAEYGSFTTFQERVAAAPLDTQMLQEERWVEYLSTRGHRLKLQFSDSGWRPVAEVNGQQLDFDAWPISESRYVTSVDRVLEVNDGQQGLRIDWRGDNPVYTEFTLTDGASQE